MNNPERCTQCGRIFEEDPCNRRLECSRSNDQNLCADCVDYNERRANNPNAGKSVDVVLPAQIIGPMRHHKTKEIIGYHVAVHVGGRKINTGVLSMNINGLKE